MESSQMRFYRGNQLYLRLICAGLILVSGCASATLFERAKTDVKAWPRTLVDNGRETFLEEKNLIALSLAGGMSVAMHQNLDIEVADHLAQHRQLRNLKERGLGYLDPEDEKELAARIRQGGVSESV